MLHWHGMHLPARTDGNRHQLIDRDTRIPRLYRRPQLPRRRRLLLLDDPDASALPLQVATAWTTPRQYRGQALEPRWRRRTGSPGSGAGLGGAQRSWPPCHRLLRVDQIRGDELADREHHHEQHPASAARRSRPRPSIICPLDWTTVAGSMLPAGQGFASATPGHLCCPNVDGGWQPEVDRVKASVQSAMRRATAGRMRDACRAGQKVASSEAIAAAPTRIAIVRQGIGKPMPVPAKLGSFSNSR